MKTLLIIVALVIIGLLIFQPFKSSEYTAYFYYDTNNLDNNWTQDGLKNLEACRGWVNAQINRDYDGIYDYECGKNCTFRENYVAVICETTER